MLWPNSSQPTQPTQPLAISSGGEFKFHKFPKHQNTTPEITAVSDRSFEFWGKSKTSPSTGADSTTNGQSRGLRRGVSCGENMRNKHQQIGKTCRKPIKYADIRVISWRIIYIYRIHVEYMYYGIWYCIISFAI